MSDMSLRERLALTVITDPAASLGPVEMRHAALRGGVRTIQVRWKGGSTREILELARALRGPTRDTGAIPIVNDCIDIALAAGADGAHLGDDDLPLETARRIVPEGFILGGSVDTPEEARGRRARAPAMSGSGRSIRRRRRRIPGRSRGRDCSRRCGGRSPSRRWRSGE